MKGTIPRLRSLHQTLAVGSSKHEEMCHAEWDTVYFHNRRIKEAPSPDAQRAKNKFERGGGVTKKTRNASGKLGHTFFYPMIITSWNSHTSLVKIQNSN